MEAIGAVDEAGTAIGMAIALTLPAELDDALRDAQDCLFVVGSELMAPDRTGSSSTSPG